MRRHMFGLIVGGIVGSLAVVTVAAQAQTAIITQSGPWGVEIECATQTAITTAVDGGPATSVTGLAWTGSGPFRATVPYPATAAARTIGTHSFAIATPAQTVTLADGTPYTYPAGTLSLSVQVVPDTPPAAQPPRFIRWLKIISSFISRLFGGRG